MGNNLLTHSPFAALTFVVAPAILTNATRTRRWCSTFPNASRLARGSVALPACGTGGPNRLRLGTLTPTSTNRRRPRRFTCGHFGQIFQTKIMSKTVRVYDFVPKKINAIPAAELAPGRVQAHVEDGMIHHPRRVSCLCYG
jgi:hypothetical protein